jgi:hypothetical protein
LKSDISCFLAGFFSCDGLSVRLIVAGLLFRQGVPPYAKPPLMAMALFATHRIFQSADRVLHLAGGLVGLAFGFQLLVTEDLSGASFTAPLACSAEPLIRSLSIAVSSLFE